MAGVLAARSMRYVVPGLGKQGIVTGRTCDTFWRSGGGNTPPRTRIAAQQRARSGVDLG